MLVVSRDADWLSRLERIALSGGWPFETRAALPVPGRTPPPERALVIVDRSLAGAVPFKAVAALRALYPGAVVAAAFDESELDHAGAAAAVACGADEVVGKFWPDGKLAAKLGAMRDHSLASHARYSADGELKAERRSHRAFILSRGRWKELPLDAGGFALLWRLLEREGEPVSREALGAVIAGACGREFEPGTVARRLAALKKALARWSGGVETARGGLYRLVSAPRRVEPSPCGGRRRSSSRAGPSRPS